MKAFALLSLLLLSTSLSFSQVVENHAGYAGLEMLHSEKRKARLLSQGKKIRVHTNDGQRFKGRFAIINDSTLHIETTSISLSEIKAIRATRLGNKIAGGVLTGTGVLGATLGISVMIQSSKSSSSGAAFGVLAGAIITSMSAIPLAIGVPFLIVGKKYKSAKGWSFAMYVKS